MIDQTPRLTYNIKYLGGQDVTVLGLRRSNKHGN